MICPLCERRLFATDATARVRNARQHRKTYHSDVVGDIRYKVIKVPM